MDVKPAIMQRDSERSRVAVIGQLAEGGGQCTVLMVHERTGQWVIYPHGVGKLGVRLSSAGAIAVAQAVLADTQ